jgi:hypothetical protein
MGMSGPTGRLLAEGISRITPAQLKTQGDTLAVTATIPIPSVKLP